MTRFKILNIHNTTEIAWKILRMIFNGINFIIWKLSRRSLFSVILSRISHRWSFLYSPTKIYKYEHTRMLEQHKKQGKFASAKHLVINWLLVGCIDRLSQLLPSLSVDCESKLKSTIKWIVGVRTACPSSCKSIRNGTRKQEMVFNYSIWCFSGKLYFQSN